MATTLIDNDWDEGMCSCGKVRFATEADALWFAKQKGWRVVTYECLGYWHVSHAGTKPKRLSGKHKR
jgi:hypothetical protein